MTVCIAVMCEQASTVVLAGDTMLSGLLQYEHPSKKIVHLADNRVALVSGDALSEVEVLNAAQSAMLQSQTSTTHQAVETIKLCYQEVRQKQIKERILNAMGFNDFADFYRAHRDLESGIANNIQQMIQVYAFGDGLGLNVLVAGIDAGVAHLYEVFNPGTTACHNRAGFHAIGAGSLLALNVLVAHQCSPHVGLLDAFLMVYEAKRAAEKVPGVGGNITDLCILNSQGIHEFPRDKIGELDKIHKKWLREEATWKEDLSSLIGAHQPPKSGPNGS